MKNLMIRAITLHGLAARFVAILLFAVLLSATSFHAAFAQTGSLSGIGSVNGFAVLGGQAVTCTDFSITGDVGSGLPGSTVNQTNCTINGTIHAGDAEAGTAYSGLYALYDEVAVAGSSCQYFSSTDTLDGKTLLPVNRYPSGYINYCFLTDAYLEGTLTLDAQGDPSAVWIFVIGTGGTGALTATNFNVEMINGGSLTNVYWWTAEAATLTDSNFQGILLAGADIAVNRGTFNGDALALGEVTLTGANMPTALVSIAVTPNPATIVSSSTQQFTATGTYSDGSSADITTAVTWTSGSEAVATISASGVATGLTAGTSTITATYGMISGEAILTVTPATPATPATLVSIAINPDSVTIDAGTEQQFTAKGTYSDGTSEVISTGVTWTSSSPSVASIIRKKGVAKGHTAGTTTITATYGAFSADATVTVTKDKKGKKK
ncbi:MAG: DUF3494 domain-containing protein [Deltaproteobacteria bacterium]|nr:DUF3494 domain-containing protein [Deltaproteobacteria bacterium]